jgi:hypothetical protein
MDYTKCVIKKKIIDSIFLKIWNDCEKFEPIKQMKFFTLTANIDKALKEEGPNKKVRSTLVTRPGFEPRQTESESAILPLYYRAML